MLKTALFDCAINEKCWRRTGPLPLFFCPHPGGLDNSRVPTPGNLPSKARTMLMPEGNWLMHNQHYISLLLWWDVDTKALKNKTHIPLSQSVAILFPQFEQNLLVSCLLCPQFEQNVLFTFCLPTKMATTSGRRNVLRKLLRISYRRLKAGFFVCWPCSTVFVCHWESFGWDWMKCTRCEHLLLEKPFYLCVWFLFFVTWKLLWTWNNQC